MDTIYGQVQQGSGIASFLPFLLIMLIIYFLMIRPQSKREKEKVVMRDNLKKGDKIITMGGIYGTVQGFKGKNKQVLIKVDNNTNLIVNRTAIAGIAGKVNDPEIENG